MRQACKNWSYKQWTLFFSCRIFVFFPVEIDYKIKCCVILRVLLVSDGAQKRASHDFTVSPCSMSCLRTSCILFRTGTVTWYWTRSCLEVRHWPNSPSGMNTWTHSSCPHVASFFAQMSLMATESHSAPDSTFVTSSTNLEATITAKHVSARWSCLAIPLWSWGGSSEYEDN